LEGLEAGDSVVTQANFLVDSESRLKAALDAMSPPTSPGTTPRPAATSPPAGHAH
jgi:Cu(I)/Ag(I) efflux system membrane fusion protein